MIPTSDRASVVGRSLDSVLGQTLQPLEVLVIDDGSTDETATVVGERASGCVHYIRLPKRMGAQAARNRGIRQAQGDWIAFQDSDDEWLSDKLERQVALLASRDFDQWTVAHGQALVMGPSGPMPPMRVPRVPEESPLETLFRAPATFFSAMIVSRVALERIGGLDEDAPSFHEWDTAIRLAHFCRFVEPDDPVFLYRRGEADAISSSHRRTLQGYQYVIEKFHDEIVEHGGQESWNAHIVGQLQRSLEFGLWDEAGRFLSLMRERDVGYYWYALCRRMRIRPSYVDQVRGRLVRPLTRRRAATRG